MCAKALSCAGENRGLALAFAALVLAAFGLMAWACWRARRRALRVEKPRDWRETWCVPECMAAHEQDGPCLDCPARRAARWAR